MDPKKDYNCTAFDVKVKELKAIEGFDACGADNTAIQVKLRSMVEAASDTR